jgi:hypothetical protein
LCGELSWGAGPIFSIPSSNQPATETGQYAAGAALVTLKTAKSWVYGALVNKLWKIAGSDATPRSVRSSSSHSSSTTFRGMGDQHRSRHHRKLESRQRPAVDRSARDGILEGHGGREDPAERGSSVVLRKRRSPRRRPGGRRPAAIEPHVPDRQIADDSSVVNVGVPVGLRCRSGDRGGIPRTRDDLRCHSVCSRARFNGCNRWRLPI